MAGTLPHDLGKTFGAIIPLSEKLPHRHNFLTEKMWSVALIVLIKVNFSEPRERGQHENCGSPGKFLPVSSKYGEKFSNTAGKSIYNFTNQIYTFANVAIMAQWCHPVFSR